MCIVFEILVLQLYLYCNCIYCVQYVLYCFCNFVCCVLFQCGVLFFVLCLIVVPLPPGTNPFAVKINNNNNNNNKINPNPFSESRVLHSRIRTDGDAERQI
jgi:hypothetical protein